MSLKELTKTYAPMELDEICLNKLEVIGTRLQSENKKYNLTALTADEDIAILHFADCLQLVKNVDFAGKTVVDVGCGGGFPSLVIGAAEPSAKVHALDSTAKKLGFVAETATLAGMDNISTLVGRAEELVADRRESFDIAVSRGVSRLNILAELCLPYVKVGGLFAAMKGAGGESEAAEAEKGIARLGGKLKAIIPAPVKGGEDHCVVVIEKLRPTPKEYPRQYNKIKKNPM
ncbi:MAG: 16S rRNA (guanine(527)-N(7))-methyltransferase RsmG [Ruminococcaceae bacterium]|nr:16S rRNA (guanine(527)-N(7))-methyltransferase RsmG [Oscillospiraceae bacterium]